MTDLDVTSTYTEIGRRLHETVCTWRSWRQLGVLKCIARLLGLFGRLRIRPTFPLWRTVPARGGGYSEGWWGGCISTPARDSRPTSFSVYL